MINGACRTEFEEKSLASIVRTITSPIDYNSVPYFVMTEENLKELPLDELLKLLSVSQRNLAMAKLYNHGADIVQHNKNQLEKVQKAIVNKQKDPLGHPAK